jgi:hypothetical protein
VEDSQAAQTAADLVRRKTKPEQEGQIYFAIIGYLNTLTAMGKYQGDAPELARQLARLITGTGKTDDALKAAQQSERKVPSE